MAETLPPLKAKHIKGPLKNKTFTVYIYIGEKGDDGWDNARLAFGLLPRLRIYLVKDVSLISEFVGQKKPKGVVFGWDEKPKRLLNKKEADDFKIVLKAIQKARL